MTAPPLRRGAVSAPGKLVMIGEYAILEGGPAIVAAVGRRAVARWSTSSNDRSGDLSLRCRDNTVASEETVVARELVRDALRLKGLEVELDMNELRNANVKLGLGSSAAGAVAVTASGFAAAGRDPGRDGNRSEILSIALEAHRRVGPRGSGIDVAASTWGGFFEARRSRRDLQRKPVSWDPRVHLRAVWTGAPARTSTLIDRVYGLRATAPSVFRQKMSALTGLAEDFVAALSSRDSSAVVDLAADYGRAMEDLGNAANAPIVTDELRATFRLARQSGGGAKPSGAGGGDVAIGFFETIDSADAFADACAKNGMTLLELDWGTDGVRAHAESEP